MRIGSLFSGYGGLEQGVQSILGGTVAWHSEIDPGACKILAHRYPDVPNLGDITDVDWAAVEPVDVLTGGFPCQDVSAAGKRAGIRPDTRSGLWTQFAYAIDQLRPSLVVIENVRGLLSAAAEHPAHGDLEPCPWCLGDDEPVLLRALGAVLGDLADIGYDAAWHGLRAADVGAPHGRYRVFVTAYPSCDTGRVAHGDGLTVADADGLGHERGRRARDGRPGPADGTIATPHPEGDGRDEGRPEPARLIGRPDAALGCGAVAADAHGDGLGGLEELHGVPRAGSEGRGNRDDADGLAVDPRGVESEWGQFSAAIQRWVRCLDRPAPQPTERGKNGQPRLSPAFVEWLMGLPAGWVTDVPGLTRNEQLRALGNGVVPQQAAQALRILLPALERAA